MYNCSGRAVNFQHKIFGMSLKAVSRRQNIALRCFFFHRMMRTIFHKIRASHSSQKIHIIHLDRMRIGKGRRRNILFHKKKTSFGKWKNSISFRFSAEIITDFSLAVKNAWTDVDAARHQNILKSRFFIDLLSLYRTFQIIRQFLGLQHKYTRIAHFFLLVQQFNLHFCLSSGIQSKNRYAMTFFFRKFIYKICLFHITENRCAHTVIRNCRKHHKSCQRSLIKRVDHCQHIFKCVFVTS